MSSISASEAASVLVKGLMRPEAYGHPCEPIRMVQTHISWVFLTGRFAYKVKKPVDPGFLDFTTLAARRHFCERELAINRRWARELYLGVVPITGSGDRLVVDGGGEAIEYAVKMRQFASEARLDRAIAAGGVTGAHIDDLAGTFARLHGTSQTSGPEEGFATAAGLRGRIEECLAHIAERLPGGYGGLPLDDLRCWFADELDRHEALIERRRGAGCVRACHGDAHLENLVLLDGRIVLFDGIEFADSLRWIDVLNDVVYTVMDLLAHGEGAYAARLVNRYLERTGDYDGVPLLGLFEAYRALVRAMVEAMRGDDLASSGFERYARLLRAPLSMRSAPVLVVTHGPSGSGKTTLTQAVVEEMSAIRVRTDVERKRLFGLGIDEPTPPERRAEVYGRRSSDLVYGRLHNVAADLLRNGVSVVLDGTYLDRGRRDDARKVADAAGAVYVLVDFEAPHDVLRERIAHRSGDASEADVSVLESQLAEVRGLGRDERETAVIVDTQSDEAGKQLVEAVRARV